MNPEAKLWSQAKVQRKAIVESQKKIGLQLARKNDDHGLCASFGNSTHRQMRRISEEHEPSSLIYDYGLFVPLKIDDMKWKNVSLRAQVEWAELG